MNVPAPPRPPLSPVESVGFILFAPVRCHTVKLHSRTSTRNKESTRTFRAAFLRCNPGFSQAGPDIGFGCEVSDEKLCLSRCGAAHCQLPVILGCLGTRMPDKRIRNRNQNSYKLSPFCPGPFLTQRHECLLDLSSRVGGKKKRTWKANCHRQAHMVSSSVHTL